MSKLKIFLLFTLIIYSTIKIIEASNPSIQLIAPSANSFDTVVTTTDNPLLIQATYNSNEFSDSEVEMLCIIKKRLSKYNRTVYGSKWKWIKRYRVTGKSISYSWDGTNRINNPLMDEKLCKIIIKVIHPNGKEYLVKKYYIQANETIEKPTDEPEVENEPETSDTNPPIITIASHENDSFTKQETITIEGNILEENLLSATLNGTNLDVNPDGSFSIEVNLSEGSNEINIQAQDLAGNSSTQSITLNLDTTEPSVDLATSQIDENQWQITIAFNELGSGLNLNTFSFFINQTDYTDQCSINTQQAVFNFDISDLGSGHHQGMINISDNVNNTTYTNIPFTLQESPAPEEVEESGYIDGFVINAITQEPVINAEITTDTNDSSIDSSGTIYTDENGFFAFPIPDDGEYIVHIKKENYTESVRNTSANKNRDVGLGNIALTPLDSAKTTIDSTGGQHTSSDGSIIVDFPEGSVPEGTQIEVSSTNYVDKDSLPGPLPKTSIFTYCIELLPNMNFERDVHVKLKNTRGFAAGISIPVGYLDRTTGQWIHHSLGQISSDGQWVEFSTNHFTPFDCNYVPPKNDNNSDDEEEDEDDDDECPNDQAGSSISLASGQLNLEYTLPSVKFNDEEFSISFNYSSRTAYPNKIISIKRSLNDETTTTPDSHAFDIEFEGIKSDRKYFEGTDQSSVLKYQLIAKNARGEMLPTGIYDYTTNSSNNYTAEYYNSDTFGGEPTTSTGIEADFPVELQNIRSKKVAFINNQDSQFGAGWSLDELERIYPQNDGTYLWTNKSSSLIYKNLPKMHFTDKAVTLGTIIKNNLVFYNQVLNYEYKSLENFGYASTNEDQSILYVPTSSYKARNTLKAINLTTYEEIHSLTVNHSYGSSYPYKYLKGPMVTYGNYGYIIEENYKTTGSRVIYYGDINLHKINLDTFEIEETLLFQTINSSSNTVGDIILAKEVNKLFVKYGNTIVPINLDTFTKENEITISTTINYSSPTLATVTYDNINNNLILSVYLYTGNFDFYLIYKDINSGQETIIDNNSSPFEFIYNYPAFFPNEEKIFLGTSQHLNSIRLSDFSISSVIANSPDIFNELLIDSNSNYLYATTFSQNIYAINLSNFGNIETHKLNTDIINLQLIDNDLFEARDFSKLEIQDDQTVIRTTKDGIQSVFNEEGYITQKIYPNGKYVSYEYDSENKLTQLSTNTSLNWVFQYSNDRLDQITDPKGNTYYFNIDSDNNLIKITNPENQYRTFTYDDKHLATSKTTENGHQFEYFYDEYGRIESFEAPLRNVYDADTQTISQEQETRDYGPSATKGLLNNLNENEGTLENLHSHTFTEDNFNQATKSSCGCTAYKSYTNKYGSYTQTIDALGRTTNYERNGANLVTKKTNPNGDYVTYSFDQNGNKIEESYYSSSDILLKTMLWTYELTYNKVKTYTDAEGNITTYYYEYEESELGDLNNDGITDRTTNNLIRIEYPQVELNSVITTPIEIFIYDETGNKISKQDKNSNITTYEYNASGFMTQMTQGYGSSTPVTTSYSQFDSSGNPGQITFPNGNTQFITYNFRNQITSITETVQGETYKKEFNYDAEGNLIQKIEKNLSSGDSITEHYQYNELNQLIQTSTSKDGILSIQKLYYNIHRKLAAVEDGLGNITTYYYDDALQLVKQVDAQGYETTYEYNSNGLLSKTTDPDGMEKIYTYNDLNQKVEETLDPTQLNLNNQYTYTANGELSTSTDPKGLSTIQTYDTLDRLIQTIDPAGNTINYQYDLNGNLLQITDANGNNTNYTYDSLNRLSSVTYADSTTETYFYDNNGNIIQFIDRNSQTINFTWDERNRLTQKSYQDSNTAMFTYDYLNNMITASETRYGSSISNTYLHKKLLASTNQNGLTVSFNYDNQGNRTGITYPNGETTIYNYDSFNRIQDIQNNEGTSLAIYSYNPNGTLSSITRSNNTETLYSYDSAQRLINLVHQISDNPFTDLLYGYDLNSNRIFQSDSVNSDIGNAYQYDNINQIIHTAYGSDNPSQEANSQGSTSINRYTSFNFDPLGNRLSVDQNGTTVNYGPNNGTQLTNAVNQYESIDSTTLTYDDNGNLLSDGNLTITWDQDNKISSILNNSTGLTTLYKYDALGRRIEKDVDGDITKYLYDEKWNCIEEYNGSNELQRRFIQGQNIDEWITLIDYTGESPNYYFYHSDALGSITHLTNSIGQIVEKYQYDVFGKPYIYNSSNELINKSTFNNPYLFTGRRLDLESDLYYYRNRYYNSGSGRFTSNDPLGYTDSFNTYSYSINNPIRFLDPYGLFVFNPIPGTNLGGNTPTEELLDINLYKKNKGRWTVTVRCALRKAKKDACCDGWVYGRGGGSSFGSARGNAVKAADNNVKDGCYKGHCHATECSFNGNRVPCPGF